LTLVYYYPTILDIEDENCKVDNNNPESVIKHAILKIKQLCSSCELMNLMIELFLLVSYFGTNNAIQDANLLTKELLKYENDNLIKCIQQYNTKIRARISKNI
ncbi:43544_t:CDS:2, partial [Gigaspora margarita]